MGCTEFRAEMRSSRRYTGTVERGERNLGLVSDGRIAAALELPISTLSAEGRAGNGQANRTAVSGS